MTDTIRLPRVAARPVSSVEARPATVRSYLGLLMGPGIGTFAFNAVTVTLPQVTADFGASDASAELLVAGYGIPFAALLILGGRLGDRFGRHRLFVVGMSVLLVAALAAAVAPSLAVLVAARIVQGVGAALCTPQILATIQVSSTGATRVRAIAAFSASGGIGAAAGQALGGALAGVSLGAAAGWRSVYVLAAVAAAAAVVLSRTAPRTRAHAHVTLDLAGTIELAAGLLLTAAALTFGPALGWSWPVLVALLGGAGALVLLWFHQSAIERSGRVPLLPPSLLRLRPLQRGLLAAGLFFAGYAALLYVVPRALEHGLGLTPLGAGVAMLPFAIVFAVVSLLLEPIQRRLGPRVLLWGVCAQVLALLAMLATVAFAWSIAVPWLLQPSLVVLGAAQALIFAPLTQAVVREIPPEAAGLSGGLFGTAQQLALSLGVIAIGGVASAADLRGQSEFSAGLALDIAIGAVVLGVAAIIVRGAARVEGGGDGIPRH